VGRVLTISSMRMNVADNRRFCKYGTYIASFQTRLRRSRVTRHVRTSSSIFLARLASPFVLHCVAAFLTVICWKPIDAQRSLASGVWATGECLEGIFRIFFALHMLRTTPTPTVASISVTVSFWEEVILLRLASRFSWLDLSQIQTEKSRC